MPLKNNALTAAMAATIVMLAIFPALLYVLMRVPALNNYGLIFVFMETTYYYPVFLLFPSLFEVAENHILLPSKSARGLTFLIYGASIMIPLYLFATKERFRRK